MSKKKIHIIINPAAGVKEPILFLLNKAFKDKDIDWHVSVTKRDGDAYSQAAGSVGRGFDFIFVYGGDGTVVEVAQALCGSGIPMLILPGGTSNTVAEYLLLPVNVYQVLDNIFLANNYKIENVDMAEANGKPFFLHFSVGVFSELIYNTKRDLKNLVGQFAYGLSFPKILQEAEISQYNFVIDGKSYTKQGVGLHVANSANTGLFNLSIAPNIKISDGKLDVILIKSLGLELAPEMAQSILLNNEIGEHIEHYQGKNISLTLLSDQKVSCDDKIIHEGDVNISVLPKKLSILVPYDKESL
jgi:diacylglycerol kinase family enzyme